MMPKHSYSDYTHGSESSPYFEKKITHELLDKVHELVEIKRWQIKPACAYHGVPPGKYAKYRMKLMSGISRRD